MLADYSLKINARQDAARNFNARQDAAIENQSNLQKNIQEQNIFINSNDTIHTVSANEETSEKEKIDNLAKDILLQFQKLQSL